MNNSNPSPTPPTKRRWLKKLLFASGALLVLLVVAWFVVTSESFFKGVILPRAGKAMNATVTADSASISPFSQVVIRGLKVQTTGSEPLLAVNEVRAQYSLMAMLGGTLKVDEVLIDSPVVNVVFQKDGTSNLDALKQGGKSEQPSASAPPKKSGQPPQVDLKQFSLKNGALHYTKHHEGGLQDTVEITGMNIALADVKNGASGKLEFASQARASLNPPEAAQRGTAQLKREGKYTFTLGPDMFPTQISGDDHASITEATGAFADLRDAGSDIAIEVTVTEIKTAALTLRKAGQPLGELRVAGPFDAAKREGKLTATLTGIDRRALNLIGAAVGMDFGNTRISSTNIIDVAQGGTVISLNGQIAVQDFLLTRAGQSTPRLELASAYGLTVDVAKSAATIQKLTLDGTQNGRAILDSSLSKPMTFSWGNAAAGEEATLRLILTNLNLAEWKPFLAGAVSSGTVSANLTVVSREGGRTLALDLATAVRDFAAGTESSSTNSLSTKATLNTVLAFKGSTMDATGKLAVTELVQQDGPKQLRMPPASVDFALSQSGQVIELKKVETTLAPTARAENKLNLSGRVDMTKPDAITGALKLTADALDLTDYYELFAGKTTAATPAPAPSPTEEKEPDAVTLPMRNFTAEASLGHVYLREVDLAGLQATVKLDGSQVVVNPLKGTLNGAPLKGSLDLNLGVRGFQYDFSLDAPNVPLAPLVNSFQPERKGQIAGTATASAQIKGAGVTGTSLQKNLNGKFDLVATNLSLSLANVRAPVIKSLLNIVIAIPDAIRNPTAAVGNLVGGLLGVRTENKGWVDELMKSPLNAIEAHGVAGNGKVQLERTYVASSAFLGEAAGTLDVAAVLTNSVMNFPVKVSLSKSLSDKVGLTPASTPTNAVYVGIPDFVTMGGTLGVPKPDVKYLMLAQLALQSGAGIGKNIGGATGDAVGGVLGTVGNLIGGRPAAQTNAPAATNQPAANPTSDLIRGIGGLLGGGKKQPATNAPSGK